MKTIGKKSPVSRQTEPLPTGMAQARCGPACIHRPCRQAAVSRSSSTSASPNSPTRHCCWTRSGCAPGARSSPSLVLGLSGELFSRYGRGWSVEVPGPHASPFDQEGTTVTRRLPAAP